MTNLNYLYDRVKLGIDAHASDLEIEQLISEANLINPELPWAVKGCQSCVNELVRYVFENQKPIENANKKGKR
jgi:hypothetical protein